MTTILFPNQPNKPSSWKKKLSPSNDFNSNNRLNDRSGNWQFQIKVGFEKLVIRVTWTKPKQTTPQLLDFKKETPPS